MASHGSCSSLVQTPFGQPQVQHLASLGNLGIRQQGPGRPTPDTGHLAKAMSMMVMLEDANSRLEMTSDVAMSQLQDQQGHQQQQQQAPWPHHMLRGLSQQTSEPHAIRPGMHSARRLALDVSQTMSQDLPLCTPDYATPVEHQHFMINYEPGAGLEDRPSRSPAPSPRRYPKRPRSLHGNDAISEGNSQASQSQSRSQGEPSSCSRPLSGAVASGKPPAHPNRGIRRQHEPPVIRNPYLCPGTDDKHTYHTSLRAETSSFRQHRLFWDLKQEDRLGSGNYSEVFRVVHRMSGKRYALKRSRAPVTTIADKNLWLAEVQALAAVEGHPHVVTFYDSWVEPADNGVGEWFFIRLELCGHSLSQAVSSGGSLHQTRAGSSYRCGAREPMREADLLEVLRQMASALKHIHDLGLAHLDLKPDNIYCVRTQQPSLQSQASAGGPSSQGGPSQPGVSQDQSYTRYVLGDFGLATSKTALAPATEGDARYLAPEILANRGGSGAGLDKADLFALGATLYELATGTPLPTGGDRYQALRSGQLAMLPCVSMKLQSLIKKLMAAHPMERPTPDQLLRHPLLLKATPVSTSCGPSPL